MEKDFILWVSNALAGTPVRWKAMVYTFPKVHLERKPAPQEWSAFECLQHMVDIEQVFQSRLQAFMEGNDFPAYHPEEQGTKKPHSAVETAEKFSRLREASLKSITALTEADLDRKVRHKELGPVTLSEMLHEWIGHDLIHTMQADKALLQPFIAGCGPWQVYFKDHLIQG